MNEKEFFDYLEKNDICEDMIVFIEYSDAYGLHELNELLLYESFTYIWWNDWDEGGNAKIIGFIPVRDVEIEKRW